MRIGLSCLVVLCLTAPAAADAKLTKLVKFYKKEAMVCAKHSTGIATARDRGQQFAADDSSIANDVTLLTSAHAVVADHCSEIEVALGLIQADPKATYKQLQPELDERDGLIRASRKASRQAITDSDPVIRRLIPKVNARLAPRS